MGCGVEKEIVHRPDHAELPTVDLAIGKAHLRPGKPGALPAKAPQQIDMRAQHQPATLRRRAAAAAARVIAGLHLQPSPQRLAPSGLNTAGI